MLLLKILKFLIKINIFSRFARKLIKIWKLLVDCYKFRALRKTWAIKVSRQIFSHQIFPAKFFPTNFFPANFFPANFFAANFCPPFLSRQFFPANFLPPNFFPAKIYRVKPIHISKNSLFLIISWIKTNNLIISAPQIFFPPNFFSAKFFSCQIFFPPNFFPANQHYLN